MKKILTAVLIIALVLAGWYFLPHRAPAPAAEDPAKASAQVETVELKSQSIAHTIEVFGVVAPAPSSERVSAAPYDCIVRAVHVTVGSKVTAGELLMEIDPTPDTKLALDDARSAADLAAQSLAATQERYDLKLATSQDLLTARQLDQDAKLKVASFEARGVSGAGRIVAARAGIVSKLEIPAGSSVSLGTGLITLSAEGELIARLSVEPVQAGSLAPGQSVAVVSANRSDGEKVATTVSRVGEILDPVSGAFEVQALLPAGARLFLGEHVRAEIETARKNGAWVVPRRAVLPDDDKQVMFTIKAGKAVRHEVTVGWSTDEWVEVIAKDLAADDRVVSLGNYELEDGMAVQEPEKPAGKSDLANGSSLEKPTAEKLEAKP